MTLAYPAGRCRTQVIFYRLRRAVQDVEPCYLYRAAPDESLPKLCFLSAWQLRRRIYTDWSIYTELGPFLDDGFGIGVFAWWRLWLPLFKPPTFADLTRFIADRSRWGLVEMPYDQCLPPVGRM